jgi:hypothetical protein
MKSLDEVLSERAQSEYQTKLMKVLDPSTWTIENRDSKLTEIRTLSEEVCDTTIEFIKELIEKQVDGKSVLWHKIKEQFISGEIELLTAFRSELDAADSAPEIPLDHTWLSNHIKARYKEVVDLNEKITKATSNDGEVEEI